MPTPNKHPPRIIYVPVTPAGSYLMHLESESEERAIQKLLRDAAHMPYKSWERFQERGYTIAKLEQV